jgi:hypothetical protein
MSCSLSKPAKAISVEMNRKLKSLHDVPASLESQVLNKQTAGSQSCRGFLGSGLVNGGNVHLAAMLLFAG